MLRNVRGFVFVLTLSIPILCSSLSQAEDKYPLTGKVLSISSTNGNAYRVVTDTRVYQLLCIRDKGIHFRPPECLLNDKPIAVGDSVAFREEGDWAYMPLDNDKEEKMLILSVELRTIPAAVQPSSSSNANASTAGGMQGVVIGIGYIGAGPVGASTGISTASPGSPVMPTAPVMVTPSTGGAPVMVTGTGPTGGGVVTGVPTTGGAPVTGTAIGPVTGMPIGGGGGGPRLIPTVHVQLGDKSYQLVCSRRPCEVDKEKIGLGDTLNIRIEKKWAYVSSATQSGGKEEKLRIISESGN